MISVASAYSVICLCCHVVIPQRIILFSSGVFHLPSSCPINLAGFLPYCGFLPPSSPPTFHPSHRHPPPPHPAALRGWPVAGALPTRSRAKLVVPPPEVRWLRRGSAAPHPPLEGATAIPWRHRSSSTWTTPSIT